MNIFIRPCKVGIIYLYAGGRHGYDIIHINVFRNRLY